MQDVEKFAIRRAKRGVSTQLVLFTDSPHVKHYATYRDVYVNVVCEFLNECLSERPFFINNNKKTIRDHILLDDEKKFDFLPNLKKRIILQATR